MATDTFYIGITTDEIYDFFPLSVWFEPYQKNVDPEWTFAPFSGYSEKADGGRAGIGFPRASWKWNHRKDVHIQTLKQLCPGLSAPMFIRTPTNQVNTPGGARIWGTFSCQMLWVPEDEDKQASYTLGFILEFRKLVLVP